MVRLSKIQYKKIQNKINNKIFKIYIYMKFALKIGSFFAR